MEGRERTVGRFEGESKDGVDGVIKYYMEREGGEKGLLGLEKRKNR